VLPLGGNPFATTSTTTSTTTSLNNPFQVVKPPPPTINQLRAQNQFVVPFDSTSSNLNHMQTTTQTSVQFQNNSNTVMPQFQTSFPQQTYNPFSM
jgi:hypothetical protein